MVGITYDKERISINYARLKKGGDTFEIDVDPDNALNFRHGKLDDVRDVLKAEKIFSDVKKGLLASEHKMKELFDTDDVLEVAKIILMQGDIQLTADYKQRLREERRKQIISIISRTGVDPRTNLPHPPARIESALDQTKVKIDEFKNAEEQIKEVSKALMVILPITFEVRQIEIEIPPNYTGKAYATVKKSAKVLKEEWLQNGSLKLRIEIPAGLQENLFNKLNDITHGDITSSVIKAN